MYQVTLKHQSIWTGYANSLQSEGHFIEIKKRELLFDFYINDILPFR